MERARENFASGMSRGRPGESGLFTVLTVVQYFGPNSASIMPTQYSNSSFIFPAGIYL